jgi:hypothetical protein
MSSRHLDSSPLSGEMSRFPQRTFVQSSNRKFSARGTNLPLSPLSVFLCACVAFLLFSSFRRPRSYPAQRHGKNLISCRIVYEMYSHVFTTESKICSSIRGSRTKGGISRGVTISREMHDYPRPRENSAHVIMQRKMHSGVERRRAPCCHEDSSISSTSVVLFHAFSLLPPPSHSPNPIYLKRRNQPRIQTRRVEIRHRRTQPRQMHYQKDPRQ